MRSGIPLLLLLSACGGAQTGEGGPVFCESYEMNYMGSCRQNCEQGVDAGDRVGIEKCEDSCLIELGNDSEFRDECADRALKLRERE
jgi:hypothetical protein